MFNRIKNLLFNPPRTTNTIENCRTFHGTSEQYKNGYKNANSFPLKIYRNVLWLEVLEYSKIMVRLDNIY